MHLCVYISTKYVICICTALGFHISTYMYVLYMHNTYTVAYKVQKRSSFAYGKGRTTFFQVQKSCSAINWWQAVCPALSSCSGTVLAWALWLALFSFDLTVSLGLNPLWRIESNIWLLLHLSHNSVCQPRQRYSLLNECILVCMHSYMYKRYIHCYAYSKYLYKYAYRICTGTYSTYIQYTNSTYVQYINS